MRVQLPLRVKLELAADRLDDPDLPELVARLAGQATARQVDRAQSVKLVAEALAPDELRPWVEVRFHGDPLPEGLRAELEAALRATAAVAAARLGAGRPSGVAAGPAAAGEPLDELRLVADRRDPDAEAYLVPSYDLRGGESPVAFRRQRPAAARRPPTRFRMRTFASVDELWSAVLAWFRGDPPSPLVIVYGDLHGRAVGSIARVTPDGRLEQVAGLGTLHLWVPATGTGMATLQYMGRYRADTLRYFGRADNADERLKMRIGVFFEREKALEPEADPKKLYKLAVDLAKQIPDFEGPIQYFEWLDRGTRVAVLEDLGAQMPTYTLPVVVFTEEVVLDPLDPARPSGYGVGCPPLEIGMTAEWLKIYGLLHPSPTIRETAFLSEPPVESWPPALGIRFSDLIDDIANRLGLPPGRFVGAFLISAMAHIDKRCRTLGQDEPDAKARLAQLREMAQAFGPVADLTDLYSHAFAAQDAAEALPCPLSRRSSTWLLHFFGHFGAARNDAVASMFVATCQDVLLETLDSSRLAIEQRLGNFPAYMTVTRLLLLIMLSDTAELSDLREKLVARETSEQLPGTLMAVNPAGAAWFVASSSLLDLVTAPLRDEQAAPKAGDVAYRDGAYRVLDGKGRWWIRAELDAAIATGRQEAFAIDPMLEKVSDVPEVVHRLQQAQLSDSQASGGGALAIDLEFLKLLNEVRDENVERTTQVRRDRDIAFGLATFQEAEITTSKDVGAKLSGIHQLADRRLRPLFPDEQVYVEAMRRLTATEIGRAELLEFFNLVGLTVLAIFCPPAAFLVGAVQAVEGLRVAFQHVGIQRAMLGGDEIISQAEAEAELWGAVIGAALTFLPEVPSVARTAVSGTRAFVKGETREAAVLAARQAMRRAVTHLGEMTAERFAKAFVRDMVTGYIINLALSAAIGRVTEAVARQVQLTGHASMLDVFGATISGPTEDVR